MTILAWDGKTFAADKRCISYGVPNTITKIFRINDCIVGFHGNAFCMEAIKQWLIRGSIVSEFPLQDKDDPCKFLVVNKFGKIEHYEGSPYPLVYDVKGELTAAGSGRDFAIAAMYLGCDAIKAVEVACLFDVNCGNGIDSLSF